MLTFSIPRRPQSVRLSNGIEALLLHMEDTELVRIDYMFRGGQWLQTQPLQARFALKGMQEGTDEFSAQLINSRLDNYGAMLSLVANLSYSHLTLTCLRRHLADILPIVSSMLNHPLYDDGQMQTPLSQGRTQWQVRHQQVETLGKELVYECLYGRQHPLGRAVQIEDYDHINSGVLRAYHQRAIGAATCTMLLSGCFTDADIAQVERTLEGKASSAVTLLPSPIESASTAHVVKKTPDFPTVQSAVRSGILLPESTHPDMPLVRLAATILGGYFGSRLMTNIRERAGYTYDIHGTIYNVPFGNAYVISTETPLAVAEKVVDEIRNELNRLIREPVGQQELQNVKNYITGNALRRYEWNFNLPPLCMNLLSSGRTLDDIVRENTLQSQATPEDLMRVCAQYFSPDRFINCIVG